MATAIISAMTPLPSTSQQPRPALRRATYVHVSDLTSAYNIDHARLEQELARVKTDRESAKTTKSTAVSEDEDGAQTADLDAALVSIPQKRLQPPRGGYNLCVLVGKVNVVVDKRRVDRSRVRLAEVEIGDETGTVSLRARDEQIDVLENVSKRFGAVVLRNCTLELYQGKHIRLAVTKWGKLSTYPDNVASTPPPPSKMNSDRNFSLIDLSVVASEMVDTNPEPTYNPRPTKSADTSEGGSSGGSSGGRTGGSKQGGSSRGQGQQYQQTQASTRRGSRGGDRRQARSKQSGGGGGTSANPPPPHYVAGGSATTEANPMQPQPGRMRFQGMHGFAPGYEQPIDVRQYSFPHSRQPDVLSQASAQQMMIQQQYEMQQRQFQMYHDQQERHRSGMRQGHQMQPSQMLVPAVVGSGSFETGGDYPVSSYAPGGASEQHPSVMAVVGSNPLLIPMTIPTARASGGLGSAPPAASTQEHYGVSQGVRLAMPGVMPSSSAEGRHDPHQRKDAPQQQAEASFAAMDQDRQHQPMGLPHLHSRTPRIESPFSAGKMNPQASVFAPAYMSPTGNPQGTHQMYFPFDPSQGATGPLYPQGLEHPSVFGPGAAYLPTTSGSSKPQSGTEESHDTPATSGASGDLAPDSHASGKENVQTRPA